jgi:hypothetical protein
MRFDRRFIDILTNDHLEHNHFCGYGSSGVHAQAGGYPPVYAADLWAE